MFKFVYISIRASLTQSKIDLETNKKLPIDSAGDANVNVTTETKDVKSTKAAHNLPSNVTTVGVGGATEKDGNAQQNPNHIPESRETSDGLAFDEMIKKVQEPAGTGGGKQDSPAKRGKCRNNLLSAHGRTEDGMCLVEKVMKFRGKGDNR